MWPSPLRNLVGSTRMNQPIVIGKIAGMEQLSHATHAQASCSYSADSSSPPNPTRSLSLRSSIEPIQNQNLYPQNRIPLPPKTKKRKIPLLPFFDFLCTIVIYTYIHSFFFPPFAFLPIHRRRTESPGIRFCRHRSRLFPIIRERK